jgi:general secretion pathway protein C
VILDEKQIIATRKGEDIVPGFRLAEVAPDHVVLERNGVRESLALPKKDLPAENAPVENAPTESPPAENAG